MSPRRNFTDADGEAVDPGYFQSTPKRAPRWGLPLVSVIAAAMAWEQNDTILALVAFAWAGFGAAFGPTVLLSLYWRRLSSWGALAGMIVGAATVGIWGTLEGGIFDVYEILPGFVFNLVTAVAVSLATHRPDAEIEAEFDEQIRLLASA